jgi:hypothetical protein
MHKTMENLYLVAKTLHDIEGQSQLANKLNKSPQVLNNWEARGMSKGGILLAAREFGVDPYAIEVDAKKYFESERNGDKPKDRLSELLTSDPQKGLEEMLLNCYRGCKGEDRDLLLSIANQLFARAKPNDKKAAPFGRRKTDVEANKNEKQKNNQ